MNFVWPHALWALLALPLLPLAYALLLRRRGRPALRYSDLRPVKASSGRAWRRHVPPVLLFGACALLLFAAPRPTLRLSLPWTRSTIMLAMDTSLSMRVGDVEPSRMAAAQDAAKKFLLGLPREVEVGLVTFANGAQVAQRATLDRRAVADAIDGLQMQIGTAIGDAIVACLAELFPEQGLSLTEMTFGQRTGDLQPASAPPGFVPVAPGSYPSAAIVLLSDGRRTTGVDTLAAAKMAADRGVRIYVIGLGTVDGKVMADEGMAIYMKLDEPTLREVARLTGGEYHHAGTADDLRNVYRQLGSRLQVLTRETELAPVLALVGALLVATAALLSWAWFGRIA